MSAPRLTHVFDLACHSTPVPFPTSVNEICNLYAAGVEGGTLSTADGRLSFPVLNASDWMTMAPDAAGITVDARVNAQNAEGGFDLRYQGKLRFSPELMEVFQGKKMGTEFGEGYYYTTPSISSRSEEFKWVNEAVFLGQGVVRLRTDGKMEVAYKIFKVE